MFSHLSLEHPSSINSAMFFSSSTTEFIQIREAASRHKLLSVRYDEFLLCFRNFVDEVDLLCRMVRTNLRINDLRQKFAAAPFVGNKRHLFHILCSNHTNKLMSRIPASLDVACQWECGYYRQSLL